MPLKINVIVKPKIKNLQKWIDGLMPKLKQFKGPLKKSTLLMQKSIAKNFAVGGRPIWEKLDDNTVAKKGGRTTILVDTGVLKDSFKSSPPNNKEAKLTSATPYGYIHQVKGTKSKEHGFLARPFMLFQKSDVKDITQYFLTHVKSKIKFYQKGLIRA